MSTGTPISLHPTRKIANLGSLKAPDALIAFWSRAIARVAGAIAVASVVAVVIGFAMPRGPVDSSEALILMAI